MLAGTASAQQAAPPDYPDPPEEDESIATPTQYVFNPLQAKKEIDTGNFYAKKGNYKAAAMRYREATLWDDSNPEAFFKLAEAYEKLDDFDRAREAYASFLKLTADKGKADDVRKRMAKFPPPGPSEP